MFLPLQGIKNCTFIKMIINTETLKSVFSQINFPTKTLLGATDTLMEYEIRYKGNVIYLEITASYEFYDLVTDEVYKIAALTNRLKILTNGAIDADEIYVLYEKCVFALKNNMDKYEVYSELPDENKIRVSALDYNKCQDISIWFSDRENRMASRGLLYSLILKPLNRFFSRRNNL